MIARAWHCDGPECNVHTHAIPCPHPPVGWIVVDYGVGSQAPAERAGEFCGWECVMKHAATFPPPIVIPFDGFAEPEAGAE